MLPVWKPDVAVADIGEFSVPSHFSYLDIQKDSGNGLVLTLFTCHLWPFHSMPTYITSYDSKQDLYKEMMALALSSSTGLLFKWMLLPGKGKAPASTSSADQVSQLSTYLDILSVKALAFRCTEMYFPRIFPVPPGSVEISDGARTAFNLASQCFHLCFLSWNQKMQRPI